MGNDISVKISVIIPVFQVEPWISQCIASLKAQKLRELEFIFVDDCGTDGSMEMIEAFAREDTRVRILTNDHNVGPGISRNKGIEAAKGEYLSFLDPDDWVNDDFYLRLYQRAIISGSDIIKGNVVISPQNKLSKVNYKIKISKKPLWMSFSHEHFSAIYAKSLFEDGKVRYGKAFNSEDTTFILRACMKTSSISIEPKAVYHYRERQNSAFSTYSLKRSINELVSLEERINLFFNHSEDKGAFRKQAYVYLQRQIDRFSSSFYYLSQTGIIPTEEYNNYLSNLIRLIKQIPNFQLLTHNYMELSALLDYVYLIPGRRVPPTQFEPSSVTEWVRFFKKHPDAPRAYSYGCAYAVVHQHAYRLKKILKSGQSASKRLTKPDLSGLDRRRKWQIRHYYPKAAFQLGMMYISYFII